MTYIYIAGPGSKIWIRSRPKGDWRRDDLSSLHAFENWDPDRANLETHEYEVTEGIYLQQPGRRHAVIGSHTDEHVALWRVHPHCHVLAIHNVEDAPVFEHLFDMNILHSKDISPICLFLRQKKVPEFELEEAASVGDEYSEWREWVSEKYVCPNSAGETMNWEQDVFSISYRSAQASLLHMAVALTKYHAAEAKKHSPAEIFQYFTPTAFRSKLLTALRSYDPALATQFTSKMRQMDVDGFFLFEGEELVWVEL
ncbi:hypothetical protein R3P38DRAFT_2803961 [Favolaschia claudopus]|uniref:Uncharacterized protein n=1 Tax=Favolaschia claudopus TaxID=2862362 RepID=A0AAV9ZRR1_9AGAR